MAGIKETKELIKPAVVLAVAIIKHVKDGVQTQDIPAIVSELYNSDAFKLAVVEAVKGCTQCPAEVADLDMSEIMELGGEVVTEILAALKS
jgi:hypothetical protein